MSDTVHSLTIYEAVALIGETIANVKAAVAGSRFITTARLAALTGSTVADINTRRDALMAMRDRFDCDLDTLDARAFLSDYVCAFAQIEAAKVSS